MCNSTLTSESICYVISMLVITIQDENTHILNFFMYWSSQILQLFFAAKSLRMNHIFSPVTHKLAKGKMLFANSTFKVGTHL